MSVVKIGDSVKVHYVGKFDSGDVFDASEEMDPLAFTVGAGQVIPGFDQAMIGMSVGETRDIVIPPAEAYGERVEELVQTIERSQLNLSGIEPEIGMGIEMQTPQGSFPLVVTDLTDTTVTLDANHPLAGRALHFSLTLVEISA
ncbi:MAG: peptidylprolyl isomerase [Acidobacteriota bacterium]|nr:MAG: peptidylprolyl isomerase [Acidobacteriota bacterium]